MREIETIQADIRKLESVQAALFTEMAPLQKRAQDVGASLNTLREELGEAEVAAQTASGVTDWAWVLRSNDDRHHGMARYKAGQAAIESLGMTMGGRWNETGDTAAQIRMYRDDPASYDETRRAIETLVPHMRVWTDGWLRFGIFEHTLSEHGIYQFEVQPDFSRARIMKTTYGRDSVAFEGSFDDALKRVQAQHYYQKKRNDWE